MNELSVAQTIGQAFERIKAVKTERTHTHVIAATYGLDHAYGVLCALLDEASSSPS